MEVLRARSKSGRMCRIVDDIPSVHYYCIEYAKYYEDENGTTEAWFPLFYPQNKCFRSWDEVKELFDKTLED